ncbi:hypothetical protein D9X30_3120 [Cupriavidus sp. U2]|nr:hypothetical protein D9X30_3120 [Cupriavidus sp. U2]
MQAGGARARSKGTHSRFPSQLLRSVTMLCRSNVVGIVCPMSAIAPPSCYVSFSSC